MKLTHILGSQYIWADALCTVQDGDNEDEQLMKMASISAVAALIIVVGDAEDADAGLRGLESISAPRNIEQSYASISPVYALLRPACKQVWDGSHQRTSTRG